MSAHEHDRLSAYLDRELPAEATAEVAAHLQRCRECRQELELLRLAGEAAAGLPAEAPSGYFEDFAERVSARIANEERLPSRRQPRRGTRFAPAAWTWALAAALLLAVVTPLTLRQLVLPGGARFQQPASVPTPLAKAEAARTADATVSEAPEASEPAGVPAEVPAAPARRQRAEAASGSAAQSRPPAPAPRADAPSPPGRARAGSLAEGDEVPGEPPSPVLADVGAENPLGAASSEATAGVEAGVPSGVPAAPAERREAFTARDKAAASPEMPVAAAAEPLSASAAGQASGASARKPLTRAGAPAATFAEYERDAFRVLAERRPGNVDEWRRLRDDWLAFGRLLGSGSELGDEASVRGVAAALEVVRASARADDLAAFREAAGAYLASPHARQKPRVQALLAAAPTSRR